MKENEDKEKKGEFLKNADVRAGKIPGWPGRPETNGDPFDPNNMARTDASMVVSEGMVLRNIASLNAASKLGLRRKILFTALLPFLAYGGWHAFKYAYGYAGIPTPEVVTEILSLLPEEKEEGVIYQKSMSELEESRAPGFIAYSAINEFYSNSKSGIAGKYDTSFLVDKFGFPGKPAYDVSFSKGYFDHYMKRAKEGYYDNLTVASTCGETPLKDCLKKFNEEAKFGLLYKSGEKMDMYVEGGRAKVSDLEKPNPAIEGPLAKFKEQFPKEAPTYCDSASRKYADMLTSADLTKALGSIKGTWTDKGELEFNDTVKKVGDINELIAHRVEKDKECENIKIAALKVNDGAIRYMISAAARSHNESGEDNVGQALYLLVRLNDKEGDVHEMLMVGCNNCGQIPALDESDANRNLQSIIPHLTDSAEAIVDVFEDGDLEVQIPTNNKKEGK